MCLKYQMENLPLKCFQDLGKVLRFVVKFQSTQTTTKHADLVLVTRFWESETSAATGVMLYSTKVLVRNLRSSIFQGTLEIINPEDIIMQNSWWFFFFKLWVLCYQQINTSEVNMLKPGQIKPLHCWIPLQQCFSGSWACFFIGSLTGKVKRILMIWWLN